MKRLFVTCFILSLIKLIPVRADNGMWLLPLIEELNYADMKGKGLKLTSEQIYSINSTSLKDAIVLFGKGCTGGIISSDGLLITNHHCGYDLIQNHSSIEHDFLTDGFWAMSREKELPNPDLSVTFLISITEVTDSVLKDINREMDENVRDSIVSRRFVEIENSAVQNTNYKAKVYSFFNDNQFFLFVFEKYLDVRLVGAPPSSIGKFGDETDNWTWPRHTGDFSMFRVYSGPDGKPAKYSPNNIPLKTKYHLPINLKGYNDGDFTMILGYPGSTSRFLSSWGVEELSEVINPNRVKIRGIRQSILKDDMLLNQEVAIKYASKYAKSSNYWKYSIGQNEGFLKLNVIERKKAEEEAFKIWIKEEPERETIYHNVLSDIESYYSNRRELINNLQLVNEVFLRSIEIVSFAHKADRVYLSVLSEKGFDRQLEELKELGENFYKEYNVSTDIKVANSLLKVYNNSVTPSQLPDFYKVIEKKYKGNYEKFVDYVYAKSIFTDEIRFNEFIENFNIKKLQSDPIYLVALSVDKKRQEEITRIREIKANFERARRIYTKGLMEMNSEKQYSPEANSTMRLTYGEVGNYSPSDAIEYGYYTTMSGIMEKENPRLTEFIVPDRLKEIYKNKEFVKFSERNYMPVCFTTNNDITGGNSGSPVLNSNGELIGLAFDGNWEAMSGDVVFEPKLQKTICVDVRYVLLIIDQYAGAGHLIEEMTIVE